MLSSHPNSRTVHFLRQLPLVDGEVAASFQANVRVPASFTMLSCDCWLRHQDILSPKISRTFSPQANKSHSEQHELSLRTFPVIHSLQQQNGPNAHVKLSQKAERKRLSKEGRKGRKATHHLLTWLLQTTRNSAYGLPAEKRTTQNAHWLQSAAPATKKEIRVERNTQKKSIPPVTKNHLWHLLCNL